MHHQEQERLTILLQDQVNNITNLRYGNYVLADSLTQRSKRLATKYFPDKTFLPDKLDKINFKSSWNESYRRLLTVSQAMLDEVQSPPEQIPAIPPSADKRQKFMSDKKKKLYTVIFLVLASFILWTFNALVKWSWLTNHPKKIAIYLSFQLAIIFTAALFFTSNKQIRFIEWLSVAVAMASTVISLLY